jgi:hypothetical protein
MPSIKGGVLWEILWVASFAAIDATPSDNDGVATTRMTDRFRSKISRKPKQKGPLVQCVNTTS